VGKFAASIERPNSKSASASGGFAPDPLTMSSASGLRWGICPDPRYGLALAMGPCPLDIAGWNRYWRATCFSY